MHETTELLTAQQLAERLGVSPETILAWGRQGHIPTIRASRKVLRYDLRAVIAALSKTRSDCEVSHGE